jgi:hypothetical protein
VVSFLFSLDLVLLGTLFSGIEEELSCLRRWMGMKKCTGSSTRSSNRKQYVGLIFGRITVVEELLKRKGKRYFRCRCDCGNEIEARGTHLTQGGVQSCGCWRDEKATKMGLARGSELSVWKHYLSHIRAGAKGRGISVSLSIQEVKEISSRPCYYCGEQPVEYTGYKNYRKAVGRCRGNEKLHPANVETVMKHGIDRVDNTRGYELGNVVACCAWCNKMKMDHGITDFLDKIEKIHRHWSEP